MEWRDKGVKRVKGKGSKEARESKENRGKGVKRVTKLSNYRVKRFGLIGINFTWN